MMYVQIFKDIFSVYYYDCEKENQVLPALDTLHFLEKPNHSFCNNIINCNIFWGNTLSKKYIYADRSTCM